MKLTREQFIEDACKVPTTELRKLNLQNLRDIYSLRLPNTMDIDSFLNELKPQDFAISLIHGIRQTSALTTTYFFEIKKISTFQTLENTFDNKFDIFVCIFGILRDKNISNKLDARTKFKLLHYRDSYIKQNVDKRKVSFFYNDDKNHRGMVVRFTYVENKDIKLTLPYHVIYELVPSIFTKRSISTTIVKTKVNDSNLGAYTSKIDISSL